MPIETVLLTALLDVVVKFVAAAQSVPTQRKNIRILADQVQRMGPLLEEILKMSTPLSPQAKDTFNSLWHALDRAYKVVQKLQRCSKLRLIFQNGMLADELSCASSDIQACLGSLPLVQVKVSSQMHDSVKEIQARLADLTNLLKDNSEFVKEQADLSAEVLQVLRGRCLDEASSYGGSSMEHLLSWLAKRFNSDVETVRLEWQEMKDAATSLRQQVDYTTERKQRVEEELLQQIIVLLDDQKPKQCTVCVKRLEGYKEADEIFLRSLEPLKEITCAICLNVLEDAVMTSSGHSYCRQCIESWFAAGNKTCPQSRAVVSSKLFENIALRGVVTRWKEMSSPQVNSAVNNSDSGRSTNYFIEGLPNTGKNQNKVGKNLPDSILRMVALLNSEKQTTLLKGLSSLCTTASTSEGQIQVFIAGAVLPLTKLLQSPNPAVVERAVKVLEALTFENKGEDRLGFEEREQISLAVTEMALETLIFVMQVATPQARVCAAQTVANILVDEEVRDIVLNQPGIIPAFFALSNIGRDGYMIFDLAKETSVKGLMLLAGSGKVVGGDDETLATALISLAGLGSSEKVVEDSLIALESLMASVGAGVCKTCQVKGAKTFLVHSLTWLPAGAGRLAVINILRQMAQYDSHAEDIIDCGLIPILFEVIVTSAGDTQEAELLTCSIKLLSVCVAHPSNKARLALLPTGIQTLVDVLVGEREASEAFDACKLDILSLLEVLCHESEFKVAVLSTGGVAILVKMVESSVPTCREQAAKKLRELVKSGSCHTEICQAGGVDVLSKVMLLDDSTECQSNAVVALETLALTEEARALVINSISVENMSEFLRPRYKPSCREAAAGLLGLLVKDPMNAFKFVQSSGGLNLMRNMLCHGPTVACKWKAAEVLLNAAKSDERARVGIAEGNGLQALLEFAVEGGKEFKEKLTSMLALFCLGEEDFQSAVVTAGGHCLLFESIEKGRLRETAAAALAELIKIPLTRAQVLEDGFIASAVKSIKSGFYNTALTEAIFTLCEARQTAEKVRDAGGLQAMLHILGQSPNIETKKLAAVVVAKLIPLDPEWWASMTELGGIAPLIKLVQFTEVLEALVLITKHPSSKLAIYEERGVPLLIPLLTSTDTSLQGLALQILVDLSRENTDSEADAHRICLAMVEENIVHIIFGIVQNARKAYCSVIKNAIIIIRNLSMAGPKARAALLGEGEGAIKVLLGVLWQPALVIGWADIVQVAVISLQGFMQEPKGRDSLIMHSGISLLVTVLQQNPGIPSQAKSFATKILVMLAEDQYSHRAVCTAIFEAKLFSSLKDVLEYGAAGECRKQAAVLLKHLITHGPTKHVCSAIAEAGCIPALLSLRSFPGCTPAAQETLEALAKGNKKAKALILKGENYPWAQ